MLINNKGNVNPAAASGKCSFKAGDSITIEMHAHNTRSCTEEAIGGAHWGPVLAYMSKVEDAASDINSEPSGKRETKRAKSLNASAKS